MTTKKIYKGWLILLNKDNGYWDVYCPDDAEQGVMFCRGISPEWDGCGTIAEAIEWIDSNL